MVNNIVMFVPKSVMLLTTVIVNFIPLLLKKPPVILKKVSINLLMNKDFPINSPVPL